MEITTTTHKRCVILKTGGRIDGSNAQELADALKTLTDDGKFNVVFDMSDVNFLASAGWWVLIDAQKRCKEFGRGEIKLAAVHPTIVEALKMVGMEKYFESFADVISAVGSF